MIKADLVKKISDRVGTSQKVAELCLNAAIIEITEALASGDSVTLTGFGSFKTKRREARTGVNPRTREPVEIPAHKSAVFSAGKTLTDAVNAK